jgi:hypothetical protein
MKTISNIVCIISMMIFFSNCTSNDTANSDTVDQSEIYQTYHITYDSGEKELTAKASFRFGGETGTSLLLSAPANVMFDGNEMTIRQNVFTGTYYELNLQTIFKMDYTFSYTDCKKTIYTNSAKVFPVEILTFPEEAEKNEGFSVGWEIPLQIDESISLTVEDKKNTLVSFVTEAPGAKSITITPAKLKNLEPGEVSIFLKRESDKSLKMATHLGGKIYVSYISKKIGLILKDTAPASFNPKDSTSKK